MLAAHEPNLAPLRFIKNNVSRDVFPFTTYAYHDSTRDATTRAKHYKIRCCPLSPCALWGQVAGAGVHTVQALQYLGACRKFCFHICSLRRDGPGSMFGGKDPKETVREWKRQIKSQQRALDKQIRGESCALLSWNRNYFLCIHTHAQQITTPMSNTSAPTSTVRADLLWNFLPF